LPKVTRTNGHIAITYLVGLLEDDARSRYGRALAAVTGLVCLATAAFIAIEGAELFAHNVLTSQATRIPKWPIALVAFLGMASSGLHLLLSPRDELAAEHGL
jgi:TRAP-type C4-dicarboxylate transport system permease small subunit